MGNPIPAPGKAPPNRPVRFVVVGIWNTAFGYLAYTGFWALLSPMGVHYVWALFPAQVVAVANAYLCHRIFVFGGAAPAKTSFLRYTLVYWVTFAANLALLPLLVTIVGLHPLVAQGILIFTSATASYLAHSRFSFRHVVATDSDGRA